MQLLVHQRGIQKDSFVVQTNGVFVLPCYDTNAQEGWKMKIWNYIALTLVLIGALNWGLIGFFRFDLITSIFGGSMFWLSRVIFALVGIAALWSLRFYPIIEHEEKEASTMMYRQ